MATWVYPPIPPEELKRKEEESLVSLRECPNARIS